MNRFACLLVLALASAAQAAAPAPFTCSDGTFFYRSFTVAPGETGVRVVLRQLGGWAGDFPAEDLGLPAGTEIEALEISFMADACVFSEQDSRIGRCFQRSAAARALYRDAEFNPAEKKLTLSHASLSLSSELSLPEFGGSNLLLHSRAASLQTIAVGRRFEVRISSSPDVSADAQYCRDGELD